MGEQTYTTVDKSTWGPGPWHDEPDKVVWVDPVTGLDCMIVRNPGGAWCGYVGVPPEHPWHGKDYNAPLCGHDGCYEHTPSAHVEVHGGLTFAAPCQESADPARSVCHIPQPGRPDDVWWLGFDCCHSCDHAPAHEALIGSARRSPFDGVYRDQAYVTAEVESLAQQLAEVTA